MSEIAKLYVTLDAKIDNFKKNMAGVSKKLESAGKSMQSAGKSMTTYITAPIMAAGVGAIGLANKYASMGDDIAKTATKLGVSTDALQEMDYWAGQNGLSSQALERAVGRLNQRIGRAADGNEKYAGAFQDIDVALHDTQGNLRSTEDVMDDTITALMGIEDPALQSARASEIFGTKMARDLMPALQDGSLSMEEAREKIHELGGVMSKEATEAAEQYQDSVDDLQRAFSGVFMELANKFIPIITNDLLPAIQGTVIPMIKDFIETVSDLTERFMSLSPTTQKYIGIAIAVAAALGPVLLIAGKIVTAVGAVGTALSTVALGPVVLIVGAIAGTIAIFTRLWKTNEDFRDAVLAIWEHIKKTGLEIWETLKTALAEVFESIRLTAIFVFERLQEWWDTWGDTMLAIATAIWNQIKLTIETVINIIAGVIEFVMAVIRGDWEAAWNAILGILETVGRFIYETVENILTAMAAWMATKWEEIKAKATEVWEAMKEAIATKLVELYTNTVEKLEEIWTYIKSIPEQAKQWGADIINGIWEGIKGMGTTLKDNVTSFIDENIPQVVKDLLGIASRSKLMFKYGGWVVQGLIEGMLAGRNELSDAAKDLGDIISDSLSTVQRYVKDTVSIIQKEFKLWKLENQDLVSSSEVLERQLEAQKEEQLLLIAEIDAMAQSLKLAIEVYGEASEEAMGYKSALLDLQISQAELGISIKDTTEAMNEQTEAMKEQSEFAKEAQKVWDDWQTNEANPDYDFQPGRSSGSRIPMQDVGYGQTITRDGTLVVRNPEGEEIYRGGGDLDAGRNIIDADREVRQRERATAFAAGGIATGPTYGLFGEAGPEAILPLAKLLPMMTDALLGAAKKVSSGTGGTTSNMSNEFHFHSPEPIDPAKAARLQEKTMRKMALEWGF